MVTAPRARKYYRLLRIAVSLTVALLTIAPSHVIAQVVSREEALVAMRKAAGFFRSQAAAHGGYVYYYSPDFSRRLGEGKATEHQIWVQPPGTPTVGMAYLKAFAATRDPFYLDAATETTEALLYGQLASGGWSNAIDFGPNGTLMAYRHRNGRGKNNSSLDDGTTQAALLLLMRADQALGFKHPSIHEGAQYGLNGLLGAQFASGGFPQVWTGPVAAHPATKAQYPTYDWKTENRIKNYWDMPTLNDGLAGSLATTLLEAAEIYKDERYRGALEKLGDFLLLAQMPEPQPGWAQQYDHEMRPIWARKFEPPAIAGRESQDAMETLLRIHRATGNPKYLEPIPRALAYLKRSLLPDGSLARFYELKSNKPLFMTRDYALTYSDADVPQHYGWKTNSHLEKIEKELDAAKKVSKVPGTRKMNAGTNSHLEKIEKKLGAAKKVSKVSGTRKMNAGSVREIIDALDSEGRWISTYTGQSLVGQPEFKQGEQFISSEVFSKNLKLLSDAIADR